MPRKSRKSFLIFFSLLALVAASLLIITLSWNSFLINRHLGKNQRILGTWVACHNDKTIEQYFTLSIELEGLNHFNLFIKDSNGVKRTLSIEENTLHIYFEKEPQLSAPFYVDGDMLVIESPSRSSKIRRYRWKSIQPPKLNDKAPAYIQKIIKIDPTDAPRPSF